MLDLPTLILQCSLAVHPQTVTAVIQQESKGHPYALNTQVRSFYPANRAEAVQLLAQALREGRSTDIGLMQVNSQWLPKLNLTPEALLDPCTNIRVGTWILSTNYGQTWAKHRAERPALMAALSMYNTGSESRGLVNGYVARVSRQAGMPVALAVPAEGGTQAQPDALPRIHPRAAPTGFAGTGPRKAIATP